MSSPHPKTVILGHILWNVVVYSIGFFFFNFYWKRIALQYCAGFCHTSSWVSHRYIYVSSLLKHPWSPSPPHPSRLSQNPGLSSLCHTADSHLLSVLHMEIYMFLCYSLLYSEFKNNFNSCNHPVGRYAVITTNEIVLILKVTLGVFFRWNKLAGQYAWCTPLFM